MAKRKFNPQKASRAIGLKVRQLRYEKEWTLEECEEHGWPNWRHLQTIEAGKNITIHTLVNLSNLFGIHPSEILKDI